MVTLPLAYDRPLSRPPHFHVTFLFLTRSEYQQPATNAQDYGYQGAEDGEKEQARLVAEKLEQTQPILSHEEEERRRQHEQAYYLEQQRIIQQQVNTAPTSLYHPHAGQPSYHPPPVEPQQPLPESLSPDPPSKVIHFRNVTAEVNQVSSTFIIPRPNPNRRRISWSFQPHSVQWRR